MWRELRDVNLGKDGLEFHVFRWNVGRGRVRKREAVGCQGSRQAGGVGLDPGKSQDHVVGTMGSHKKGKGFSLVKDRAVYREGETVYERGQILGCEELGSRQRGG